MLSTVESHLGRTQSAQSVGIVWRQNVLCTLLPAYREQWYPLYGDRRGASEEGVSPGEDLEPLKSRITIAFRTFYGPGYKGNEGR